MEAFSLNKLYQVFDASGDAVIEVVGGTVKMYTWLAQPTSSPVSDDFNAFETIENAALKKFVAIPKYVYFTQDSGTTTAIKAIGIRATVVA